MSYASPEDEVRQRERQYDTRYNHPAALLHELGQETAERLSREDPHHIHAKNITFRTLREEPIGGEHTSHFGGLIHTYTVACWKFEWGNGGWGYVTRTGVLMETGVLIDHPITLRHVWSYTRSRAAILIEQALRDLSFESHRA